MSIYPRKDSKYLHYDFRFRGKRYRGSTHEISNLRAKKFEDDLKYSIRTGNQKKIKEIRFDGLVRLYKNLHANHKRSRTFYYYACQHLADFFLNKRVADIGRGDIDKYIAKRLQKVKPVTVNREISVLKHMLNKAIEWDYLAENPAKGIKKFPEKNRREYFLSKKEAERLINACPKWLRPFVIVALNTGARRGELLALTWDDIDFVSKSIQFRETKNDELRRVPMNDDVESDLKTLRTRFKGKYVFGNFHGEELTAEAMRKPFEHAVKRAGLTGFRFHDLRHSFASFLAKAGVPLNTVRELLGHKSIEMTLRYSHLSPDHKNKAVKKLPKILRHISPTGKNSKKNSKNGRSAQVLEKNGAEEEGRTPTGINAH